jgi:hypothetical protein
MRKLLIVGAIAAGAALVAKRMRAGGAGPNFERMIERMPEDAPPKWIYRNVTAIRENTERILQLLEQEGPSGA